MTSLGKCAALKRIILYAIFIVFISPYASPAEDQAVLKLLLNEQDKGEFFFVIVPEGDILMPRNDFEQLGLKEGLGQDIQVNGATCVSLKSIPGLQYSIEEETVSLEIKASPSLFREQDIDTSYAKKYKPVVAQDRSAFLNYSFDYENGRGESFTGISGEFGVSVGDYLGTTTFTYQKTGDEKTAARLMSSLVRNYRDTLQTVTFGDFQAYPGPLGSAALLGGIQYSSNFSIDPSLVIFPPLKLNGTLETPSDVEIYLDGALVRKEKLLPGEFTFNDIPATTGLGTANMVIKDAYGRERNVITPYYYSNRLLKKGLHEYSYSAGFMKKDFGTKSFSYGKPAFLAFHNYGFSEKLKAGYAAEASTDVMNIGAYVSFLAGNAGVIDSSIAFSARSGEPGLSGMMGYFYQSRNVNVKLVARSDSRNYSNLAVKPSDDKAKIYSAGAIGFGGKKTGYLTAEYSYADMYQHGEASRVSLSYSRSFSERASFFVSASETRDSEVNDEILLGLHVYFGKGISGSLYSAKDNHSSSQALGIHKSPPPGAGFGFGTDILKSGDNNSVKGALFYQNNHGQYEINVTGDENNTGYGLSLSGGIGYIDRSIFLSRPITDSFAKVKVSNLKDVRVYHYSNEVGVTDSNGELIIPNLSSFQDNRISIESQDIPLNYTIRELSKYLSPSSRSGSLLAFSLNKMQALTGTLSIMRNRERAKPEFGRLFIQANYKILEGLVGRSGEFYIENIPPGTHQAWVMYQGSECRFSMTIPDSDEILLDMGDIACEQ
ncbi:MAG: fimbrial biogenesis outer membrane usher protein [Nitrospiraceae bacterium]|nr:MAG: fimbrial biogenesis outer membrane usher protein [Nitrospiraceae bacterium]